MLPAEDWCKEALFGEIIYVKTCFFVIKKSFHNHIYIYKTRVYTYTCPYCTSHFHVHKQIMNYKDLSRETRILHVGFNLRYQRNFYTECGISLLTQMLSFSVQWRTFCIDLYLSIYEGVTKLPFVSTGNVCLCILIFSVYISQSTSFRIFNLFLRHCLCMK